MKKRRIFIAINLPEDVKKQLVSYQTNWPELPVRWIGPENIHLTLEFLGYVSDEELIEICKIVKEVASRHKSFTLKLIKVCYGPPEKKPPRMIWVMGEKFQELASLKDDLEKTLVSSEKIHFSSEKRAFSPHLTLGRIRTWEFRQIEPEERPEVNEDISLSFEVNSIEVMESQLKRGGAEYTILESCPLKS